MDISMASGGNVDHGHQHALWWQHRAQTSTWSLASAQTMDVDFTSGGIMDLRSLSRRRLNQENELFYISHVLWLVVQSQCCWASTLCVGQHLAGIPGMTIVIGVQGRHQGPELSCPQHGEPCEM